MSAIQGVMLALLVLPAAVVHAAEEVPPEVQMPGTQPGELGNLDGVSTCNNCHGNYDVAVEPVRVWRGSMMAHASGDPLFWAAMTVAEQSVDGSGDLCLRCHTPTAWLGGRSTPTDGSNLSPFTDADGITCDVCHRMTNPDASEHLGVQNVPFIANDGGSPAEAYVGSAQYVMWPGGDKLGPYAAPAALHPFLQSQFHRDSAMCGTCHDVSNPFTGDLAPNNGSPVPLTAGSFNGDPGGDVSTKAAFNNPPHRYGVVERTYSEHQSSAFSTLLVSAYDTLPDELKDGSIQTAWQAAQAAGNGGDYSDGTPRTFSCQTCHMPPTTGQGCSFSPPVRTDLPLHDLTGGNYWMPTAMQWLDANGGLMIGGSYTQSDRDAMDVGANRARAMLSDAAALTVTGDTLKVLNLSGHKLISGYPEGRRMWLNLRWYDAGDALLREDGAYGSLNVTIDGSAETVETLLDLSGANTRIYEVHGAITQAWAQKLIDDVGVPATLPVAYDRVSGAVVYTLGQIAAQAPGTWHESTHFVLNNHVASDNRIPPYGMRYDDAYERLALPVPDSQYGNPGAGGVYDHWDELQLDPPPGAVRAEIDLKYQPTSWEYIQFLHLANDGSLTNLAHTGADMLAAWRNTGMAEPHVMASTQWTAADTDGDGVLDTLDNCTAVANANQRDTNGDGYGNLCDADFNGDGIVNFGDVAYFKSVFLGVDEDADLNGDGSINFGDLALVKAYFLLPPGPSGLVPGS